MLRRLFMSAAGMLALTVAASAADRVTVRPAPPLPAPFSWAGIYTGAEVGYGWGKATFVTSGFEFGNPDLTGFLGGVYVGGNFAATGLAVVGVELNADFANLSGHFSDINTGDAEQQWESALRLRLGIPVGNALLYGAVGVVVGGFEYHANGGGVAVFGYHRYAAGGTVGAGVEYALDSHLISRIEVRYNDFLDIHGALPGFVLHNDAWTAQVRGGVAYKY
ncbi:MAG: outer membrane beta-barrel protein [Bauldia sp.]